MRYFFAQWNETRRDTPRGPVVRRKAPPGSQLVFNFDVDGWALFRGDTLPPGALPFGDGLNAKADVHLASQVLNVTGLRSGPVRRVLMQLLTEHGDPIGASRWKPIQPERSGQLRVLAEPGEVIAERFVPERHPAVLRGIQERYRRMKQAGGPSARFLWRQMRTHRLSREQIIPSDMPREEPEPPRTSHTEDFDVADQDSLGPDLTWTETWGAIWDVASNQAQLTSFENDGAPARAEHDVSDDDMFAEATITASDIAGGGGTVVGGDYIGVCVRHGTGTNTNKFYAGVWAEGGQVYIILDNGSDAARSQTELAEFVGVTSSEAPGELAGKLRIEAEGSTIRVYEGTTLIGQVTDSTLSGFTRGGIIASGQGMALDDFRVSDELATVVTPPVISLPVNVRTPTVKRFLTVNSNTFDISADPGDALPPAPHFPANTSTEIKVEIVDKNFRFAYRVEEYQSVRWKHEGWGENSFTLVVPSKIEGAKNPVLERLVEGNHVKISVKDLDEDTWHEDFIGRIGYVRKYVDETDDYHEIKEKPFLGGRIVVPASGSARYAKTGAAETLMKELVTEQAVLPTDVDRRMDHLAVPNDQGRGGSVTVSKRYHQLVDALDEIAQQADIGWEIQPDTAVVDIDPSTGAPILAVGIAFDVLIGVDRSKAQSTRPRVVFSPEHVNIRSQAYEWNMKGRATTAYVGGQGEGVNRTIKIVHAPRADSDPDLLRGLFIEGTDSYVAVPTLVSVRGLTHLTLEGWVSWREKKPLVVLYHESVNGDTLARLSLQVDVDGHLQLHIRPDADAGFASYTSTFQIVFGGAINPRYQWVAAKIRFDENKLWLRWFDPETGNGATEEFTHSGSTAFEDTAPDAVFFGKDPAGNHLHGALARWRLWGGAPTDAFLDKVRLQPFVERSQAAAGFLKHEFRFDDGYGIWVKDYYGGKANDAEVIGSGVQIGDLLYGAQWVTGPDVNIPGYYAGDRNEVFIDARDVSTDAELEARAMAYFADQGPKARLEVEILSTGPYRYGVHYKLWDIVTVENDDWDVAEHFRITGIELFATRGETPRITLDLGSRPRDYRDQMRRGLQRADAELLR